MGSMPSLRRQHLLAEFAGLKQACPEGVFVSLTPGDPMLWSGVMFVRHGPYATAILRFQISFPDTYPRLPPLVTFSTDIFHPLITPLTTYMYTTDIQDNGTVSATDAERLPPGGFSLRHGFPAWFGRGSKSNAGSRQVSGQQQQQPPATPARGGGEPPSTTSTPSSKATPLGGRPGYLDTSRREVSTYEVLRYIRSTFDDEKVLDSVPLEAAGNPGAWHAWRTRQRQTGKSFPGDPVPQEKSEKEQESDKVAEAADGAQEKKEGEAEGEEKVVEAPPPLPERKPSTSGSVHSIVRKPIGSAPSVSRKPGEWNWEGVWEDRVQKGIATSLSEAVLYGATSGGDDLINFLAMEEGDVDAIIIPRRQIITCITYRLVTSTMGLSTPVAAVLIVLVTVVPMLLIAGFTARFISRNFRDAAGAIEPKPARRWFGLRRVKSNDSATTSLATNTLHYADSWPDLESLRTYQDTPTPSIQRGIHESFELEFLADKAENGSERGGPEVPQPLKVLKRLGRDSGGESRGDASGSQSVAETDEGVDGVSGPFGESLVDHQLGISSFHMLFLGHSMMALRQYPKHHNAILSGMGVFTAWISKSFRLETVVFLRQFGMILSKLKSPRSTAVTTQQGHVKHRSDELIDDLEYQLGDSNLEYIRVSVKYNHSAFFCQSRNDIIDNIAEGGTKLETFATAIVKQHNHRSPWSPSPAPTYNPIASIILGNWGPSKARNVIHRISPQRPLRAKSRMDLSLGDEPMDMLSPPVIPRREASLGRDVTVRKPDAMYNGWSAGRRRTLAVDLDWGRPRAEEVAEEGKRWPSTATCPGEAATGAGFKNRFANHLTALRSPRSIGPGVLRGLASSVAGTRDEGHEAENRQAHGGESPRGQGRKSFSRWSWTSWWS
ncbi:ubiquitin-conjugating enzyme [Colletotrichum costaricense]|uniref:Ubiquitin-conjugating enzyme n=1 Tax=Colletotrichum costaricense TaxID=1209916 RepID=A0AAJ0DSP0_9PEZI|nr:ubiquitin-conjugating enzyme [Colletotrichum costaricense]KAK1507987.1 ubiquitin-conjugating enzyme [Colletotrichum costaricense]